jgi:hypothetical protein
MIGTTDRDHVISQGTLRNGSARVDYYTTMPTPSQWIAVGVMTKSDADEQPAHRRRKLIVGSGTSEVSAISDLNAHFIDVLQELRAAEAARRASRRSLASRAATHSPKQSARSLRADVEFAGEEDSSPIYH